jgi:hypothetical protein
LSDQQQSIKNYLKILRETEKTSIINEGIIINLARNILISRKAILELEK